jgi:hypothetical protein
MGAEGSGGTSCGETAEHCLPRNGEMAGEDRPEIDPFGVFGLFKTKKMEKVYKMIFWQVCDILF